MSFFPKARISHGRNFELVLYRFFSSTIRLVRFVSFVYLVRKTWIKSSSSSSSGFLVYFEGYLARG